jgi:hypothetical protein
MGAILVEETSKRMPAQLKSRNTNGDLPANILNSGLDHDQFWRALTARDIHFDGKFVFAVASTGIYCRPSCPAA